MIASGMLTSRLRTYSHMPGDHRAGELVETVGGKVLKYKLRAHHATLYG